MTTWNTIARNKRVEWGRRETRLRPPERQPYELFKAIGTLARRVEDTYVEAVRGYSDGYHAASCRPSEITIRTTTPHDAQQLAEKITARLKHMPPPWTAWSPSTPQDDEGGE